MAPCSPPAILRESPPPAMSLHSHHRRGRPILTTDDVTPSSPPARLFNPHHRRCHSIHTTGEVAPSSPPTMSLHPHHRRGYSIRISGYVTPSTPPARSRHPHHRRYHSILTTDEVIRLCHSIHTTGEVTRVYSTLTSGDVTQSSPPAMLIPPRTILITDYSYFLNHQHRWSSHTDNPHSAPQWGVDWQLVVRRNARSSEKAVRRPRTPAWCAGA
jgi:hypothetical protein